MNKVKEYIKLHKTKLSVIFALAGAFLIVFSTLFPDSTKSINTTDDELSSYGRMLENRLKETLSAVTGEDCFEIMITFKSSFENVYNDEKIHSSQTANAAAAFLTTDDSKAPIVIKRKNPEIAGVVIACKRLLDTDSVIAIKQAAATVLNVSKNKIYIIGGDSKS